MKTLISRAIPLPIENVDTDQIIPARFLKATDKKGFGENLFHNWRYHEDGSPNQEFVLNNSKYSGSILVADNNFGCGSSREHAAWALAQYGFQAIISTEFADIFQGNALNNGILPVVLPTKTVGVLLAELASNPTLEISIDLESQMVSVPQLNINEQFAINSLKKEWILNGMDETAFLINLRSEVEQFEAQHTIF